MARLADVLTYIFQNYPSKGQRSKSPEKALTPKRVIMLVYLADWKSAIYYNKQISDVSWEMVDFEPKLDIKSFPEVTKFAERKSSKVLTPLRTFFFGDGLKRAERGVIDEVIKVTRDKSVDELDQLVHSTFPAITKDEKEIVDLPELAGKYKEIRPWILPNNKLNPKRNTGLT